MHCRQSRSLVSGFTLIELVVVMTTSTILSGIAISLLAQSLASTTSIQEQVHFQRQLTQLSSQFRNDVQLAQRVQSLTEESLFLVHPNSQIEYSTSTSDQANHLSDPGPFLQVHRKNVFANGTIQQETYHLLPDCQISFEHQNVTGQNVIGQNVIGQNEQGQHEQGQHESGKLTLKIHQHLQNVPSKVITLARISSIVGRLNHKLDPGEKNQ